MSFALAGLFDFRSGLRQSARSRRLRSCHGGGSYAARRCNGAVPTPLPFAGCGPACNRSGGAIAGPNGGARRDSGGRVRGCEYPLAPLCMGMRLRRSPSSGTGCAGATFSRVGEKGKRIPSPWWGGWTARERWPGEGMRRCRILLALVVERPAPHPWPSPRGGGGNGHGCAAGVGCLGGKRSEGTECLAGVPGNVAYVGYAEVRMAAPNRRGASSEPAGVPIRRLMFPPKGRTGTAGTLAKSTDGVMTGMRVCRVLISTSPPLRWAVSRFRKTARGRWTPEPFCHHRHEWVSTSPL